MNPTSEPFWGSSQNPIRHGEEWELVRLSQEGSNCAFEQLVRRNQKPIFNLVAGIICHTKDVEDVAQQVFLKAYRGIRTFDQRAAFSTWLYRIAFNECQDYFRKQRTRLLVYEADLSEAQASRLEVTAYSASCDGEPSQRMVAKAVLEDLFRYLSASDRQLLILREIEGFSIRELATILDLKSNNVKIRLFRARGRLANAYRLLCSQTAKGSAVV
jgi:RNA polymerase sigma-70 factor, ECF subfamily